jgi:hypothetical protein
VARRECRADLGRALCPSGGPPYYLFFSFIHLCIQCLGHFSPLPPSPCSLPSPLPLLPHYQAETIHIIFKQGRSTTPGEKGDTFLNSKLQRILEIKDLGVHEPDTCTPCGKVLLLPSQNHILSTADLFCCTYASVLDLVLSFFPHSSCRRNF